MSQPIGLWCYRQKWTLIAVAFAAINLYGVIRMQPRERAVMSELPSDPSPTEPVAEDAARPALPSATPSPSSAAIAPHPALPAELSIIDLRVTSPAFEAASILMRFSEEVDAAALRRRLGFEPDVEVSVDVTHSSWQGYKAHVRGGFVKGRHYTLRLARGLASADGTAVLAKDFVRVVSIPDAAPAIRIREAGQYLSPSGTMQLPLRSINAERVTLVATRIAPRNLVQYAMREGRHYQGYYGRPVDQIGVAAGRRTFDLSPDRNTVLDSTIPLRELLPDDPRGAFMLDLFEEQNRRDSRLVVVTDTGLTLKQGSGEILVWANAIHSLAAVTGALAQVWSPAAELLGEGVTDAKGLVTLPLERTSGARPFLVTVTRGQDVSFLSLDGATPDAAPRAEARPYVQEGLEAYLYTDRGIYRPGETAHVRAIVRGPRLALPPECPVDLEILRPDGRPHSRHQALLSAMGTAAFTLPWADFDATGRYRLMLKTPGATVAMGQDTVSVEAFVPPRMAVEIQANPDMLQAGQVGTVSVRARYLYGAPVAGNPVATRLTAVPKIFKPEGYTGFYFGNTERKASELSLAIGSGHLQDDGSAFFSLTLPRAWRPASMLRGVLSARVMDQGGRTVSAYAACDLHVYPFYIGLRTPNLHALRPGDTAATELALVNPDGQARRERRLLELELVRLTWSTVMAQDAQGRYNYQSVRRLGAARKHTLMTDDHGRAAWTFSPGTGGHYLLLARDAETEVASALTFHVGGLNSDWQSRSMEAPGRLQLALDRAVYRPGDTARLTVTTPFAGKALLTVEQDRVLHTAIAEVPVNTAVFEIPVTTNLWPNAHVAVRLIREVVPDARPQVYRATGALSLPLDPTPQRLRVALHVPERTRPSAPLAVQVSVTDQDGHPQQAEFTLAAVDEGICALTAFQTPDPVAFFTAARRPGIANKDLYAMLLPETDNSTVTRRSHTGGDIGGLLRGRLNPIRSRRFVPVALWQGARMTDERGRATVVLSVPEFSGALRLMAVAVTDTRCGASESRVVVTRPLAVLSSLPRFLAPGDRCDFPIELRNHGEGAQDVHLVLSVHGPVALDRTEAVRITLDAGARSLLNYNLRALEASGLARIGLRAVMGDAVYDETIELPVRPPAARTGRHTVLALAPGASHRLSFDRDWLSGSAAYELTFSARPAVHLRGAVDYLLNYPYGCLEQTVSTAAPALYLPRLSLPSDSAYQVGDPTALVQRGIERVLSMQLAKGGFAYWPTGQAPYEWGSVYAMEFLLDARKAGYALPPDRLEAGLSALRQWLDRPVKGGHAVGSEPWRTDAALRAYACHVLACAGNPRHAWTARLLEQAAFMSLDARLRLVLALAAGGQRRDAWHLLQACETWSRPEARQTGGALASPMRTAALQLNAWLELAPDEPQVLAAMKRLEALRTNGRWHTTQENAMALRALARYMNLRSAEAQSFRGAYTQNGRQTSVTSKADERATTLPDGSDVTIVNDGPGTMYIAATAAGIPLRVMPALDQGLAIRREYLTVNQTPLGDTRAKQGELLIVRLTLNAGLHATDNLVIEALLPAGLEIEQASLKTSQMVRWAARATTLPTRHVDSRDDRIVIFAEAFSGVRVFHYAVRAVTPGAYTLPPVTVEAMYDPSLVSRSGAGTFVVERYEP